MKWLRWIAVILGVIVILAGAAFGGLVIASNNLLNKTYDVPEVASIEIPTDEASLAEGERLFITRGCADCHGEDGAGRATIDAQPMGYLPSSNLTSGEGGIGDYSDEDILRSLRHGIDPQGRGYLLMPSHEYSHFSDRDMGMLIAYIRSLEPVDGDLGEPNLGPVGRIIVLTEPTFKPAEIIDHENVEAWDIEPEVSERYGEYVAIICQGCHTDNYSGGPASEPGAPASTNITFHEDGLAGWTLEDFGAAMRTGVRPDGSVIDPYMPWGAFSRMTDTEIEAMYVYLQSVPEVPYNTE